MSSEPEKEITAAYEGSYNDRWFVMTLEDGTIIKRRLWCPKDELDEKLLAN